MHSSATPLDPSTRSFQKSYVMAQAQTSLKDQTAIKGKDSLDLTQNDKLERENFIK